MGNEQSRVRAGQGSVSRRRWNYVSLPIPLFKMQKEFHMGTLPHPCPVQRKIVRFARIVEISCARYHIILVLDVVESRKPRMGHGRQDEERQ